MTTDPKAAAVDITQTYTNMSKAIQWQIPFSTNNIQNPTLYRLDIYAEGYSGDPIQLTAGESPFVTDEDSSEDFFAPIRTHTGRIQVCTRKPDGTMLTLDEILPANNIDHPVRLLNITNPSNPAIEWQGFLSCEAYSQNYTAIPENLTLSVISVLEAMDSVEANTSLITGLKQARIHLYYALTELDRQIGMSAPLFSTIYYSKASAAFMTKSIDATILYNINEYTNEESTTYVVGGLSCKELIKRICTYMGWCCRENAGSVYLYRMCEDGKMYTQSLSNLAGTMQQFLDRSEASIIEADISDFDWRSTDHKRDIRQGAKSVEVVANLSEYELQFGLPEFPTNDMVHGEDGSLAPTMDESYSQMNTDFNNMLTFSYYNIAVRETSGGYDVFVYDTSDVDAAYNHCALNPDCVVADYYKRKFPGTLFLSYRDVGAFFAMLKFKDEDGEDEWWEGLYITTTNEINATDHAPVVFGMNSIINYRLVDGLLRFKISALTVANIGTSITMFTGIVQMKLQFGSLYWDGSTWTTIETFFNVDFANSPVQDDDSGYILEIPVTSELPLSGAINLEIRGSMKGGTNYPQYYDPFYDLFIYELELEYEAPEYVTENDRSENKYYRLLGTNFRDEISVSTELASNLNNRPSPSLVMNSITKAMTTMNYNLAAGGTEPRRPEVDLLNRLASYYGASRQTLDLITKHPVVNNAPAVLPLLKLNGIGDGKQYLPLSESRDWRTEVCTLKCFETI